ncbi:MAG: thiamine pyrophosphate-binding protein [Myxococcales bacterium]|nr:thiamine pyrophosphate-binding protein [Myxococcales bacterium]MCB9641706.1 thiamine pyrophosphate-binding protein [Myxococcales bacterium]
MAEHIHGGSIVGEVLAAHGVSCLYNLCGGHISPILHGAKMHGLKVVDVRDEATAAFAADAASRMTGIPGVCAVTAGPGVTNTVTAVKNAQEAQQPIIILGGATATVLRGRGSLQDIDQLSLMKPITKWAARCNKVGDLVPMLEKAFAVATEGVPGPVFLEIPVDVLYPKEIVEEWYIKESGVGKMKGIVGKAAQLAMKGYLQHQFHMPHLPILGWPQFELPFDLGVGRQLDQVKSALEKAEKPVLVIGNQAMVNLTPDRAEELASAVRKLGVPTFLGGASRGLLGRFSDIQFRHQRSAALKEADVVIVAGFPFDFRLGYGLKINKNANLVSINLDPVALKKNRKPTIAIQAHPGRFLVQLAERSGTPQRWDGWFRTLQGREESRDAEILASARPDSTLIDPIHLFLRIEDKLAEDSVLIVDGGDFVATGSYIVRPRGPLSWLDPGVFGTLGVGGGFAVGASSVRPSAEVWLFYGDGSCAYSIAEFDTFVRSGFAPIAVIGTDASWQQIARDQIKILGDAVGTELRRTDYHIVAEGYGGKGILVTDSSQIDSALDEAKRLSAEGVPVCINVHLASSDFREGSLSI